MRLFERFIRERALWDDFVAWRTAYLSGVRSKAATASWSADAYRTTKRRARIAAEAGKRVAT